MDIERIKMNDYKIIRGFRNVRDIDRLKINITDILKSDSYISFLKDNNLRGLTIISSDEKHTIDFSFLIHTPFLEYLEVIIPLSKKSDISGIYALPNLKYLRWIVDNRFDVDFSMLKSLNGLNITDYGGMKNWNSLTSLKQLGVHKLNNENCIFISDLKELTDLSLSRANITSIEGLENCDKLERLELSHCLKISELTSVLKKCPNIISVSLKKCKNIDKSEVSKIKDLGISLWVE